jgi:hypothetical protein
MGCCRRPSLMRRLEVAEWVSLGCVELRDVSTDCMYFVLQRLSLVSQC